MTGRPLAPCGTPAAYQRHLYNGEPPDDACKAAQNKRMRDYLASSAEQRRKQARKAGIRSRAWTRLAAEHPARFAELVKEETARYDAEHEELAEQEKT